MMMVVVYDTIHTLVDLGGRVFVYYYSHHLIGYYCLFEQYEKLYLQTCSKYLTKYLSHARSTRRHDLLRMSNDVISMMQHLLRLANHCIV